MVGKKEIALHEGKFHPLQAYLEMISKWMKIASYKGFSLEIKICFYFIAEIISRHGSKIESVQYYSAQYSDWAGNF